VHSSLHKKGHEEAIEIPNQQEIQVWVDENSRFEEKEEEVEEEEEEEVPGVQDAMATHEEPFINELSSRIEAKIQATLQKSLNKMAQQINRPSAAPCAAGPSAATALAIPTRRSPTAVRTDIVKRSAWRWQPPRVPGMRAC